VSKSYGPIEILTKANASIERGDKIALIGANGKGKSTLLRILSGSEPVQGDRTIGYNVIKGFYAQHQLEALNVENEILDELKQAGSGKLEQELRGILGCFLFTDEDQFKKIKVLSGGEKSRVALAKTLISEANFLLLDEPTNHLDFISENILIQALQQYLGSFVVVSHNRYFINQVANKIWYIEDHQVKEYPGTYEEYEYWRSHNPQHLPPPVKEKKEKAPEPVRADGPTLDSRKKKLNGELKQIEDRLAELEKERATLEGDLGKPETYEDNGLSVQYQEKLSSVVKQLEEQTERWDQLVDALDALEPKV
jgi:ATP-binding cassette subfamily F protein 3